VDGSPDKLDIRIWQDGVTTYAAPTYRTSGTVARGIIIRSIQSTERDFGPEDFRRLAERE
jgi:hypothetical protein